MKTKKIRCIICSKIFISTWHSTSKRFPIHCSKECSNHTFIKVAKAQHGEKHPQWKGDRVSYQGLHQYIRYHLKKPEKCVDCKKVLPYDVANISQEYKRDLSDWEWICRKCHLTKDGRLANVRKYLKNQGERRESCEL